MARKNDGASSKAIPTRTLKPMYRLAEVSWARGDFEFFKAERNLTG